MRPWILFVFLMFSTAPLGAAEAVNPVDLREWSVPFDGHTRDPDAVAANEVWFVGQRGDYLARLNPQTGHFFRRDLEDGVGPHNLIVGDNGIVWYAGNLRGYIGRYDPKTDTIEPIVMPDPAASDPHTLIFDAAQRHIWFTVQRGNFIGRLAVATRRVVLVAVPSSNARPYGIAMAPDGAPWIALFGTNKLARVDPATLVLKEFDLPAGARPRRLEVASDGWVFYVDYRRGFLGRVNPETGGFREWPMPSGAAAQPYGMAIDGRDRIWFVESGPIPNMFVGFDALTETFFSRTPIPSGGGTVRHMNYHAATGTVWFGTDEDTIGRAVIGD